MIYEYEVNHFSCLVLFINLPNCNFQVIPTISPAKPLFITSVSEVLIKLLLRKEKLQKFELGEQMPLKKFS
jgi:hypothetical protein